MPKRKVGRPKGTLKTGGRVKKTPAQLLYERKEQARDSIWSYVIRGLTGQAVKSRGPTGKAISQPLSEDNQVRLLQTAWKKLEPDLNATAIKAEVTSETTYTKPRTIRDQARAVLHLFEHAKLEEEKHAPPPPPPEPAYEPEPAQLLLTRDKIIDITPTNFAGQPVTATGPAGPRDEQSSSTGLGGDSDQSTNGISADCAAPLSSEAKAFDPYALDKNAEPRGSRVGSASGGDGTEPPATVSSPPRKPEHADKVEVDSNSSHIWFNGETNKWAVIDSDNVLHGWKRDRAEALAHAERLPRGAGPWQAHPFEPQDMGSGWHERRDNRATISNGKLNVVRRMPRGAR